MKGCTLLRFISTVLFLMFLVACGSSPKTNFYMLNTRTESTPVGVGCLKGDVIAMWAVRLPDYLDRQEIVVRNSPYAIEMSDSSWWAGDLRQNISNLLGVELGKRLTKYRIIAIAGGGRCKKDFQIKTYVDRFDGELGGDVVFSGAWVLLDGEGKQELLRENFNLNTTATDETYEELVTALSQLTIKLSEQMALAIIAYKKE